MAIDEDTLSKEFPGYVGRPDKLTKQKFRDRIYDLMMSKNWTQSDLARRAGLPRDAISTYMRAKSFPTPRNLKALAAAFGMTPAELLPSVVEETIRNDVPSLSITSTTAAPNAAWVHMNRMVDMDTAIKILALVKEDKYWKGSEADAAASNAS